MPTNGDAPLNLIKPEQGDAINLSVINYNYDTINTLAADHETRLDTAEATNTTQNNRLNDVENMNTTQNNRLNVIESGAYVLDGGTP